MSGGGEGEDEGTLEFTPTWVVAAVCTVIVAISLAAERLLHFTGKVLTPSHFMLFIVSHYFCEYLLLLVSNFRFWNPF